MPSDSISTPHHRIPHLWMPAAENYAPEYVEGATPAITTSIVDSIGADTVSPHILTAEQADRIAEQHWADSIVAARAYAEAHAGHSEGLPPMPMPPTFDSLDAVSAIVVAVLALAGLSARSVAIALKAYHTALWSVRRRANAFDDSSSAPLRASLILALTAVVFGGLALYCSTPYSLSPTAAGAFSAIGVAAAYYLFQLCAYAVTGYAFATPSGRSLWMAGYVATQAYMGIALTVPAILLLFVPAWHKSLLYICAGIFIIGKIIFICKGFRIFYNKFRSLLYFILYLCTLEIIPVLAFYAVLYSVEAYIAA